MKPRFIALNLLLLTGIGVVAWQARTHWREAREARRSALAAKGKTGALPPLAPDPKPDAPPAAKYVDVATNDLFSKDRNPTVVIEPPPVEKPKEMPHLPVVYGVMGLPGGTRALMAEKADVPGKTVRAGDSIGEFKIASLDPQTVVFNWDGKDITRRIEDLMDRSGHAGPAGRPAVAAPGVQPPMLSAPAAMNPPPMNPPPPPPNTSKMGADVGTPERPERICVPGDNSPAGTIVEGFHKTLTPTPFGLICRWEPVGRNLSISEYARSFEVNRILLSGAAVVLAMTLLAVAGDAQNPAQQATPAQQAPTVPGGLNLNNASLLDVINTLAQDLHINYILDANVKGGSVTMNTYGAIRDVDLRPLLETILRMNNLAMVQAGNIYRIVPIANIARQPVSPIRESDPAKLSDDERLVMNLVFLRYMSSTEMAKILTPFIGDGAQLTDYEGANLLIVLDNSRNMKRTLELINMFDSDTFAGQRVRSFDVKERPSDRSDERA